MLRATRTNAGEHDAGDSKLSTSRQPPAGFADRREVAAVQRRIAELAADGPRAAANLAQRAAIDQGAARTSQSGLPDALRAGVENLSGMPMDQVKVHYNSAQPARMNAHAYAQGDEIHLGPGQERHLPHEAWHVVQQRQGRVRATMQMAGVGVNEDAGLESEADTMGARAMSSSGAVSQPAPEVRSQQGVSPSMAIAQLVRAHIAGHNPEAISLNTLRGMKADIDNEVGQIQDEEDAGFIDMARVRGWLAQYANRIATLEQLAQQQQVGDDDAFTTAVLKAPVTDVHRAMRNVAMTLAYIGKALNDSLEAYNNKKEADEALEANRNASAKKVEEQDAAKDAPKKTPTRGGPVGLQNKWGNHNQNLAALATNTQFVQLVPKNAATIQKSVKSQNILDAVYHTDKAFWMAAEKSGYRLGDSADKVMVRYTFTSAGAQSLMQDYLICGSGDYAEDNEEQWKGETAHPNYTIWKTNEIGAFGVGANRLRQLASKCIKIEQVKK